MTGGGRGWCNPYSPLRAGGYPYGGFGGYAPGMLPGTPYAMGAYAGWPATGYGMASPFYGGAFPASGMLPYAAPYGYRPFGMGWGMRMRFGGRGMWGGRGRRMWW